MPLPAIALGLALAVMPATPNRTIPMAAGPGDPAAAVLGAFAQRDIVLIAEEHSGIQVHALLHQLIADPRLAGVVNDIVVEFGNPLYQDIVDRYISGEDVSLSEVRPAWRNTTQIVVWDSPLYEALFTWIRTVNSGLSPEQKYRVVLMDPAIDWSRVRTKAEYEPYAQRSRDQLARVEAEVLAKHRKALIVVGGAHVLRGNLRAPKVTPALENASLGDALGRKYPGRTFSIWTVPGRSVLAGSLESEFPALSAPAIVATNATALAKRSFGDAAPQGIMVKRMVDGKEQWVALGAEDWPAMEAMADALLFLPTPRTLAEPQPSAFADPVYYAELLRRAQIMTDTFGMDFVQLVKDAAGRK